MKISRVLFIMLFFLLFSFALLVGGKVPYFLFYVIIFSTSLPLIHNLYSIKNIKAHITLPEAQVYQGDTIAIHYSLENKGSLSIPYIEMSDEFTSLLQKKKSKNTILSLDKKDIYNKTENIKLNRRGYYKIVAIKVKLRDILGIYSFKKTLSNESDLLVYPKPIEIENFPGILSYTRGDRAFKDSQAEDKSNIHSFREYKEGDNMKAIHWKLSSKFDNLMIKEYEKSGDTNLTLILDNSYKSLKDDRDMRLEDKIVDVSLSIVNYALKREIKVKLFFQDKDRTVYIEGSDNSDLKTVLRSFAELKAEGKYNYSLFAESHTNHLSKRDPLIFISPVLDKDIAGKILDIKIKGVNIVFIVITDLERQWKKIDLNIENRLQEEAIKILIIDYKSSIKEILEAYHE